MTNGNDAAFPYEEELRGPKEQLSEGDKLQRDGLTKREYFAAGAMATLVKKHDGKYSNVDRSNGQPEAEAKWIATAAVRYADALIEALNK